MMKRKVMKSHIVAMVLCALSGIAAMGVSMVKNSMPQPSHSAAAYHMISPENV